MSNDAISFGGSEEMDDIEGFDFTPTKLDESSIRKKIGHDIYTDTTQGFDEMVSNAFSGIWEAVSDDYIDESEGVVEVSVESVSETDQVLFTFRDNGIGMPRDVVNNVFLSFGKTLNGKNDSTVGKFGLGVAAYPNLVGFEDGKIWMETVSRETDELTCGWYTINGLYRQKDENAQQKVLPNGEYGTAYKAWLKEEVSVHDVIQWVENIAEYNSIPIELTVNGGSPRTYEPQTVYDKFDQNEGLQIKAEEEGIFTVVAGHNVPNECVIIHRTIDFKLRTSDVPFQSNIFLKLYTEEQKVCTGPHVGKTLVSKNRYDSATESEQANKYVTKDKLDSDTVVTPRITGNRESLDDSWGFKEYITTKLLEAQKSRFESILTDLETTDYFDLQTKDQEYLKLILSRTIDGNSYSYKKYATKLDKLYSQSRVNSILNKNTPESYEPSEYVCKYLSALFDGENITSSEVTSRRSRSRKPVRGIDVMEKFRGFNGDIYMGCSKDEKKYDAIKDHNSSNIFVKLDSASAYDIYEEMLGWKKLKNVNKSYVENNLNVSEETKQKFGIGEYDKKSTSRDDSVVHFGRKQRAKKRYYLDEIVTDGRLSNDVRGNTLVVFTKDSEYSISDFYDFANRNFGLLTLSSSNYEKYLQSAEGNGIMKIEQIVNQHKEKEIDTLTGTRTMGDVFADKNCLVVQFKNSYRHKLPNLSNAELAKRLLQVVNADVINYSTKLSMNSYSDLALLEPDSVQQYQFALAELKDPNIYSVEATITVPVNNRSMFKQKQTDSVRAALLLTPWRNQDIYETYISQVRRLSEPAEMTRYMYESLGGDNLEIFPDKWK